VGFGRSQALAVVPKVYNDVISTIATVATASIKALKHTEAVSAPKDFFSLIFYSVHPLQSIPMVDQKYMINVSKVLQYQRSRR
jgi:hypothetical protein